MPGRVGSSITAPGGTLELGLAPLSQPETGCLLAGLLGSEPPPDLWTEVWRRTEGVPLFIEEIFFSLRQQGALLPDLASGGWRLADETDLSSVPVTVQGMIQARLDGLEPELRRVIHRAAVLGAVFWDKALVALDVADPDPLLAMLASRDVIVTRHTSSIGGCHEYAFRSTMVRDTAYEAIPRRTRSTLHSRAADWLAGRAAAPSVLAAHLEAAGRALEAAWQHVAAGDLARGSYANEEALRHYEIAMDLAARALSWRTVEWAEAARAQLAALFGSELVLTRLGRLDDGLGALDSIVDISTRLNDRRSAARAQVRRGVLTRQRDPRAAVRMLVLARLECQAVGDVEWECDALVQLAQALASAGDLDQAASTALEAVVVARRIGSGHTLLRALMIDATVTTTRGDHWNAIRRFDDALDVARSSHDAEREAYILQSRGFLMSETGDLEAAERDLDAALFLCERTGNRRVLAYTLHNLGWVLWKLGRVDEARSVESRALEVSRDIHLALVELEAEVYLAVFDVGESRPRRALERTQHVIDVSAGYAEPSIHAGMVMALALLDLGRDEEAAGAAARAITAYADLGGTQQFEVELHLVAATCFERAGRPRDAADARERASAILDRRIAALADPVAGEKFRASVGAGLPWRNAP
jgi:tetratricopeptide (TPR) repeat protein